MSTLSRSDKSRNALILIIVILFISIVVTYFVATIDIKLLVTIINPRVKASIAGGIYRIEEDDSGLCLLFEVKEETRHELPFPGRNRIIEASGIVHVPMQEDCYLLNEKIRINPVHLEWVCDGNDPKEEMGISSEWDPCCDQPLSISVNGERIPIIITGYKESKR